MLFFSKLAFVLRTLDNEKEAVMLSIVLSKLHTLSYIYMISKQRFYDSIYIYQA